MKTKNEIRSFKLELRANNNRIIKGLGVPANKPSHDLGFIEYITPEAINKAVSRNKDITLLVAHDNSRVIARNGRNMTLTVTNAGLEFEASLLAADDDTYQRVKAGLYDSCSFGFVVLDDDFKMVNGHLTRYVNDMDILEISVLSNDAAYASTHVDARAIRTKLKRDEDNDENSPDSVDDIDCDCDCSQCSDDNHEECSADPVCARRSWLDDNDDDDICDPDSDNYDADACEDRKRVDSLRIRRLFSALRSN